MEVTIIGAGLAGCEAAWQLAEHGVQVKLYEKKQLVKNEIQQLNTFAELVCSNTFRSTSTQNAVGILKKELELLNSFILECAQKTRIPADDALAVDRQKFSQLVDQKIRNHKNIQVFDCEVTKIDENQYTIIACGPLISAEFKQELTRIIGSQKLFYLDASAPIIKNASIDLQQTFFGGRHHQDESYLCLPLTETEFDQFHQELCNANKVVLKDFEKEIFFQGCQPIEQLAKTSKKSY
ncbi:tRNA (uracil-5-)-methyltransferase Gid [Spiroplasma clarkii]|nr:methylenetetrahydrofolate--tRNA-(uracil(54)-C(5))-methyltransferase (FADH(2)-oxidizing) TrmFO [Spiroplasma clarkii]ARU91556.1 tRNA (uracil-5-)-methyltransferase Gid [Spiroplasma clarkii]